MREERGRGDDEGGWSKKGTRAESSEEVEAIVAKDLGPWWTACFARERQRLGRRGRAFEKWILA